MCDLIHDAPFKIMIKDLKGLSKCEKSWIYDFNVGSMYKTKLNKFHIQGEIIKTAGFMKEIFIIFDGTAKAKVTKGPHVPGDLSWINEGVYCSVIGSLADNGNLPHINAIKIAKINNLILKELWPLEVTELFNLLSGRMLFGKIQGSIQK